MDTPFGLALYLALFTTPYIYVAFPLMLFAWTPVVIGGVYALLRHQWKPLIYGALASIPASYLTALVVWFCCIRLPGLP